MLVWTMVFLKVLSWTFNVLLFTNNLPDRIEYTLVDTKDDTTLFSEIPKDSDWMSVFHSFIVSWLGIVRSIEIGVRWLPNWIEMMVMPTSIMYVSLFLNESKWNSGVKITNRVTAFWLQFCHYILFLRESSIYIFKLT